jgi:hypothetical protein
MMRACSSSALTQDDVWRPLEATSAIEQFTTHHDLFARWVSETLLQPVSLCAPAILVNEVGTISGQI